MALAIGEGGTGSAILSSCWRACWLITQNTGLVSGTAMLAALFL
jgi:hypothetical protein